VHRTRPDGSDNRSFPSGHTSAAFALASVAEQHYGWKVGAAAYAAAAAMGASRLMEDKHYLSDVVAGATIGYMVGTATVRVNGESLPGTVAPVAVWSVSPVLGPQMRGVTVSPTQRWRGRESLPRPCTENDSDLISSDPQRRVFHTRVVIARSSSPAPAGWLSRAGARPRTNTIELLPHPQHRRRPVLSATRGRPPRRASDPAR
jgi:hypothetical protein